ncbi:hypothetical protein DLREEDagrD3_06800 [Denitratisoma sp. agr-D3]
MNKPTVIDGRNMVPPEPLEATLDALETLPPGEELTLLLYCQPHPLYQMLRRDGYVWTEHLEEDGTTVIRIRAA